MPNLTEGEKTIIINLVVDHFSVIENKRTDAVTAQQKVDEWNEIETEFNSLSVIHYRSAENLRSAWENLKKNAKKVGAQQRAEIFLTGRSNFLV